MSNDLAFMTKHIDTLKYKAGYDASLDLFGDLNKFELFGIGDYSAALSKLDPFKYLMGYIDFVGDEPPIEYDIDQGHIDT